MVEYLKCRDCGELRPARDVTERQCSRCWRGDLRREIEEGR